MLTIKCTNHNCQLSAACQNFQNKDGEEMYIRPKIQYDGFLAPKMVCDYLLPLNVNYIVRHSKMQAIERKAKLKHEIVENFGGERKRELMKKLEKLEVF